MSHSRCTHVRRYFQLLVAGRMDKLVDVAEEIHMGFDSMAPAGEKKKQWRNGTHLWPCRKEGGGSDGAHLVDLVMVLFS